MVAERLLNIFESDHNQSMLHACLSAASPPTGPRGCHAPVMAGMPEKTVFLCTQNNQQIPGALLVPYFNENVKVTGITRCTVLPMANFVLVHGAFHGGWCWSNVTEQLRHAGHTVVAPDLPGAGEDNTPLHEVTLEQAVARVIETLRSLSAPAVLVAHSMGGVVITQAAAQVPELISRLVYITAFRPDHGESLLNLTELPEGADDGVQANITVTGEPPIAEFDTAQAQAVFYNDLAEQSAQDATAQLNPQPLSLFATPMDLADAQLPPEEYVVCTKDQAIPPALQRLMAQRHASFVHELDSGHSPFYSCPEAITDLLLDVAKRAEENDEEAQQRITTV